MAVPKRKSKHPRTNVGKKRSLSVVRTPPAFESPDEWKPFGYAGDTGTCYWCGTTLKKHYRYDAFASIAGGEGISGGLGPYEDNMFCRMRCGYQFGARMGALGERLSK